MDGRGDPRDGFGGGRAKAPDDGRDDAPGGGRAEASDDDWRDERGGDRTEAPDCGRADGRDDWKQDALEDFRQWLDAFGEEPPEDGEPEPPNATCTTCSPNSPPSGRRSVSRTGSSPGRAGSWRRRRPCTRPPPLWRNTGKRIWPLSRPGCPGRPRTAACAPSWRCATPWCGAGRRRCGFAIGPGCSGARLGGSPGSSKATSWRSGASTGCSRVRRAARADRRTSLRFPYHARGGGPPGRGRGGRDGRRGTSGRLRPGRRGSAPCRRGGDPAPDAGVNRAVVRERRGGRRLYPRLMRRPPRNGLFHTSRPR